MTTLIRGLYEACLRGLCRRDVLGSGFRVSGVFGGNYPPGSFLEVP